MAEQGAAWPGPVRQGEEIIFMFQGGAVHGRVKLGNAWLGGARYSEAWIIFMLMAE
jgi:hypothetical protein